MSNRDIYRHNFVKMSADAYRDAIMEAFQAGALNRAAPSLPVMAAPVGMATPSMATPPVAMPNAPYSMAAPRVMSLPQIPKGAPSFGSAWSSLTARPGTVTTPVSLPAGPAVDPYRNAIVEAFQAGALNKPAPSAPGAEAGADLMGKVAPYAVGAFNTVSNPYVGLPLAGALTAGLGAKVLHRRRKAARAKAEAGSLKGIVGRHKGKLALAGGALGGLALMNRGKKDKD